MIDWWVGRMQQPERLVEERLMWFWHDHFATQRGEGGVRTWCDQQHLTLRQHATGQLRGSVEGGGAGSGHVLYLDGITNAAAERNENFGRECLELFTMGRDSGYTQDDVVEASRAFTGWVVDIPERPGLARARRRAVDAVFVPHGTSRDVKTLLGTTAPLDMDGALDVILERPVDGAVRRPPSCSASWSGSTPYEDTVDALAQASSGATTRSCRWSRRSWVDDGFTRTPRCAAKYRTPVEKLVGIVKARAQPAKRRPRGARPPAARCAR